MLVWNRYVDSRDWVRRSIEKEGWDSTRTVLIDSINYTFNEWFHINRTLLHIFGLAGLLGYDGDVLELLKTVDGDRSYEQVQRGLGDRLGELIAGQWERGGTTWFFDVDLILASPVANLIPQLVEARKEEYGYVVTRFSSVDLDSVDSDQKNSLWRTLWNSWYGHSIHRKVWTHEQFLQKEKMSSFYPQLVELDRELGMPSKSNSRTQEPVMSERFDDVLTCMWAIDRVMAYNQFTERLIPTGAMEFPRFLEVEPRKVPGWAQPRYEYITEMGLLIDSEAYLPVKYVVINHLSKGFSSYPPRTGVLWKYIVSNGMSTDEQVKQVYEALLEEVELNSDVQYFLDRDDVKI
jgi:hypothetical protein